MRILYLLHIHELTQQAQQYFPNQIKASLLMTGLPQHMYQAATSISSFSSRAAAESVLYQSLRTLRKF